MATSPKRSDGTPNGSPRHVMGFAGLSEHPKRADGRVFRSLSGYPAGD